MLKKCIVTFCLLTSPCFAQQQQIASPPEVALQINSVIGQWAQTLTAQGKLIDDQNKKIKELEAQLAAQPKDAK